MADRTSITLIVHDCPPDRVRAVLAVIDAYDLAASGSPTPDQIELGEPFQAQDAPRGQAAAIALELSATAPELTFTLWQHPSEEWLGSVYRFTPDLGLFTAACDAHGTAVFTAAAVRELLDEVLDPGDDLPDAEARDEALDAALGTPWETATGVASATALSPVIAPRTGPTG